MRVAQHAEPASATPGWKGTIIDTLIVSGCFAAKTRITAVTPYFVPEPTLLMPRQSNHRLADFARHAALRELTAAGGHVWLTPGMIHAKAVIIDHGLALGLVEGLVRWAAFQL